MASHDMMEPDVGERRLSGFHFVEYIYVETLF